MNMPVRLSPTMSALLFVVFLAGCNREKEPAKIRKQVEKEIGLGVLNGTAYTNDYFNLKIEFPKNWHIASKAENKEFQNQGKAMMKSSTRNSPEFDASMARTLTLVTAFKYAPGSPQARDNCNMMILAERVAHLPGIKTGADYLHHAKKTIQTQMRLRASFQPIQKGESIGSLPADYLPIEFRAGGVSIKQRMYATRVRDYILVVGMNYQSEQDKEFLLNLLKSMQASK